MISVSRQSSTEATKIIAGRKSDLAAEIIAKGRNKMTVENKKELLERLLLPLTRR